MTCLLYPTTLGKNKQTNKAKRYLYFGTFSCASVSRCFSFQVELWAETVTCSNIMEKKRMEVEKEWI